MHFGNRILFYTTSMMLAFPCLEVCLWLVVSRLDRWKLRLDAAPQGKASVHRFKVVSYLSSIQHSTTQWGTS